MFIRNAGNIHRKVAVAVTKSKDAGDSDNENVPEETFSSLSLPAAFLSETFFHTKCHKNCNKCSCFLF